MSLLEHEEKVYNRIQVLVEADLEDVDDIRSSICYFMTWLYMVE